MIITKCFTSSGPRRILGLFLALALLMSTVAVPAAAAFPTESCNLGSGASFDGEAVTLYEVWKQGFHDGFLDAAEFWHRYRLDERLKQHHYNFEQTLAYTNGYNSGYDIRM